MQLAAIVGALDEWFPSRLAESWDNVGLLLGDRSAGVSNVMTCLTVSLATAREAIEKSADLIVTHHPILFRAVKRLTSDGEYAAIYLLARAGVAVYSPHTAFDGADGGINEQIAGRLGLLELAPMRPAASAPMFKLVVFAPASDLDPVRSAMFSAGAGVIGEYDQCSFRLTGTGSFRGSDASNPTIGQRGQFEEVAEHRLEVLVAGSILSRVVAAMIEAHSYEEPAFDIYPLAGRPDALGAGRVGTFAEPLELAALAQSVKQSLGATAVQIVGERSRPCRKVAIACGAGDDLIADAHRLGCDAVVTGEMRFHQAQWAFDHGLGVILAGHYATERFAVETLAARMAREWPSLAVWPSASERDPIVSL